MRGSNQAVITGVSTGNGFTYEMDYGISVSWTGYALEGCFAGGQTPTCTLTFTQTFTKTNTPTVTFTPTITFTPTKTFTPTFTATPTFTFTPTNTPTPDPANLGNDKDKSCNTAGGKVLLQIGDLFHQVTDLNIPNRGVPFNIVRSYNNQSPYSGVFGNKWSSLLDERLIFNGDGSISLKRDDGALRIFSALGSPATAYSHPAGYDYTLTTQSSQWILTSPRGDSKTFDSNGIPISITDRNNNSLAISNLSGVINSISDGHGRSVTFTYNGQGFVSAMTDPLFRTTSYSYDSIGNLIGVAYPGNRTAIYTYDTGTSNMIESIDPAYRKGFRHLFYSYINGNMISSEKDSLGNTFLQISYEGSYYNNTQTVFTEAAGGGCSSCSSGGGGTYNFDPYGTGLRTDSLDALGHPVTLAHDSDYNRTLYLDQLGHGVTTSYDSKGNALTITDAAGSTKYTYNNYSQPTTFINAAGVTVKYVYDSNGNLTRIWGPLSSGVSNVYDSSGNGDLLSTRDANGQATTFTYDSYGNLSTSSDPDNHQTVYTYDAAGRLSSVKDAKNNTTSYVWDAADRLTQMNLPGGAIMYYSYDENGNRVTQTDLNHNTTYYSYDDRDRLVEMDAPGNVSLHYTYDAAGNLTDLEDANHHHTTFTYDAMNHLLSQTDPLNRSTVYSYDNAENLQYRTDAMNQTTQYVYDALNRPITVIYPDSSKVKNTYDAMGNLTLRNETNIGNTTFVYDALNRVIFKQDPFTSGVSFIYDPVGNPVTVTYPDGSAAYYTYTKENAVSVVGQSGTGSVSFYYDANLNPVTLKYSGGISTVTAYDVRNQALSITSGGQSGTTVVPNFAYVYDAAGNRLSQTRGVSQSTFGYDGLNQIGAATILGGTNGPLTQSYIYDPAGNRVRFQENHDVTLYNYDEANELTSQTFLRNVAWGSSSTYYAEGTSGNDSWFNRIIPDKLALLGVRAKLLWKRLLSVSYLKSAFKNNFSETKRRIGSGERYAFAGTLDAIPHYRGNGDSPAKPSAPIGLRIIALGGKVQLTWPTSDGTKGYRVYRAASGNGLNPSAGIFQEIGLVQASGNEMAFEDAPGPGKWCYALNSFVEKGINESEMGEEACATVTGIQGDNFSGFNIKTPTPSPTITPTPSSKKSNRSLTAPTWDGLEMVSGRPEFAQASMTMTGKYEMTTYFEGTNIPFTSRIKKRGDKETAISPTAFTPPVILLSRPASLIAQTADSASPNLISKKGFLHANLVPPAGLCSGGNIVYEDNYSSLDTINNYDYFDSSGNATTALGANYQISNGQLKVDPTGGTTGGLAVVKDSVVSHGLSDYVVESDFQMGGSNSSEDEVGILFRVQNGNSYYAFERHHLNPGTYYWRLEKVSGSSSVTLAPDLGTPAYTSGTTVHLKVICQASELLCYLNFYDGLGDQLIFDVHDTNQLYASGGVGFRANGFGDPQYALFDNFKVSTCVQPSPTPCGGAGTMYFDNFSNPNTLPNYGFIYESGGPRADFAVTTGVLLDSPTTITYDVGQVPSYLVNPGLNQYTVEGDLEADQSNTVLGIAFRVSGQSFYSFQWNGLNGRWELEANTSLSSYSYPMYGGSSAYTAGTTIHMKVVCAGNNYQCYLDKNDGNGVTLLYNVTDSSFTSGLAGFRAYNISSPNKWRLDNFQVSACGALSTPTITFTPTITPTATGTPQVTNYQYDANGNLIKEIYTSSGSPATINYSYDFENRLKTVTSATGAATTYLYAYSGNLLTVRSSSQSATYVYGMSVAPLEEIVNYGAVRTKDFIQVNGRTVMTNGSTSADDNYYHMDGIGSVAGISSTSAHTVVKTTTYDPYGKIIQNSSAVTNAYEYVGGYGVRDVSTNRYVMGVRTYDASLGRFLSQDPIGFSSDSDFYRYAMNNPVNKIDPSGLCCDSGNNKYLCSYYLTLPNEDFIDYGWYSFGVCKATPLGCWSNCVRQCLVNFHAKYCSILPTESMRKHCYLEIGHSVCFSSCAASGGN